MTTEETLYVEKDVLDLLTQVNRWNLKEKHDRASFTEFFENSPVFIFENYPGYPDKIYEKEFLKNWDLACAVMIEHNILENQGWPRHNGSVLYADRLRNLLKRTKAKESQMPAHQDKPTTAAPTNGTRDGYSILDRLCAVTLFLRYLFVNTTQRSQWTDLECHGLAYLRKIPDFKHACAEGWLTQEVWEHIVQYLREEGVLTDHSIQPKPSCVVDVTALMELQKKLVDLLSPCVQVTRSAHGGFFATVKHLEGRGNHTLGVTVKTADDHGRARVFLTLDNMEVGTLTAAWTSEEPAVKIGGLFGDIGIPVSATSQDLPTPQVAGCASEKLALQVPAGSNIPLTFDGGDVIKVDEPVLTPSGSDDDIYHETKEGREAMESEIDELRARLQDVFSRSISSGPMPHRVAICIIETTLSEHAESEEILSKAGDFFAEISKISKNPIRYASWLACSELLSKVRAATKGLGRKVDSCTVEEHRSALRDLGVEVKP